MKKIVATFLIALIALIVLPATAAHAEPQKDRLAKEAGISQKHVVQYKLGKKTLRGITSAKRWAKTSKSMSVKRCESGGNYKTNTGNGYYGAWQFNRSSWLANGGRKYASLPHQAPRWAQDHIAWKYHNSSGWRPWACA